MKKSSTNSVVFCLFLILISLFEFFYVKGYSVDTTSHIPSIAQISIFFITIYLLLSKKLSPNPFLILFFFWIIYVILRFITSSTGHNYDAAFFWYSWAYCCFVTAFLSGFQTPQRKKYLCISFSFMLLASLYYTYISLSKGLLVIGDFTDMANVSNIIFWSLCLIPFVFLLKNKTIQLILLSVETIFVFITLKRSAVISISLLQFLFIYSIITSKNISAKNRKFIYYVWFALLLVIVLSYISNSLGEVYDRNITRFENIESDEGSGRIPIWEKTIYTIENSDFFTILFGNGLSSSPVVIGVSSAHNDFLTLFLEQGLTGAIFYVIFIVYMLKRFFFTYKNHKELFYPYAALLIVLLVVGNVGDLFTCYSYLGLIMSMLGVLEVNYSIETRRLYAS